MMICKFNHEGDCCNSDATQYMCKCKMPCDTIIPITNADNIRSMNDEELAEWIRNGISSDACDYCDYNNGYCDGSPCRIKSEADIIIEWLQHPAKECE